MATNLDHSRIAEKLIRHGANVNLYDDVGLSPMHVAIINGEVKKISSSLGNFHFYFCFDSILENDDIFALLLRNGADIEHETIIGSTALDLATYGGWFKKNILQDFSLWIKN